MALANAWRPAAIYVEAGRYLQAEPKVKYRGTFLNDEAST